MKHSPLDCKYTSPLKQDSITRNYKYDKHIACSLGNYSVDRSFNKLDSYYAKENLPSKDYPSCYRQNVLVMLAKKLINEGYKDVSQEFREVTDKSEINFPRELAVG